MARLNDEGHQSETSVGPRSVVAWQIVDSSNRGEAFFTGDSQEKQTGQRVKYVVRGNDSSAMVDALDEEIVAMFREQGGQLDFDLDIARINARLSTLPDKPDRSLK